MFVDRLLHCVDCGVEFVFSTGEQAFFQEKHFVHDPKRCKLCAATRTKAFATRTKAFPTLIQTRVTCAECGSETTVPFKPTQGRPVFCRLCLRKHEAMHTS